MNKVKKIRIMRNKKIYLNEEERIKRLKEEITAMERDNFQPDILNVYKLQLKELEEKNKNGI